jgi:hypothetical protein
MSTRQLSHVPHQLLCHPNQVIYMSSILSSILREWQNPIIPDLASGP